MSSEYLPDTMKGSINQTLKLQDLNHIHELRDMLKPKKLREIILDNMPIDEATLPEELRILIKRW